MKIIQFQQGLVYLQRKQRKIKPLIFFGYEPLEDFLGFDYDPYIGLYVFLGSLGVGGSLGAENSLYAALGIGIGVKVGVEEDKK